MSTAQIASRLVELCRQSDYAGAQRELYANDAISIEPDAAPNATTRGMAGIAEKTKQFEAMFEAHGGAVSDPLVADPFFACTMTLDVTERKTGKRLKLSELCLYEVRAGKIVREQFFYEPRK